MESSEDCTSEVSSEVVCSCSATCSRRVARVSRSSRARCRLSTSRNIRTSRAAAASTARMRSTWRACSARPVASARRRCSSSRIVPRTERIRSGGAEAAVGQDEPEGRLGSLLAPQADGLAQLLELVPQRDLQVADLPLDVRAVRGEGAERVQVGLDDVGRRGERRRQVALVAGQEKAALAGLRLGDSRADAVELGHDLAAAPDRLVLLDEVAGADRDHRDGTEDGGGHRELEGHPVANEPVGHVASARGIMNGCIVGQGPGRFKRSWGAVATARRGRLGGRAAVGRNCLNR